MLLLLSFPPFFVLSTFSKALSDLLSVWWALPCHTSRFGDRPPALNRWSLGRPCWLGTLLESRAVDSQWGRKGKELSTTGLQKATAVEDASQAPGSTKICTAARSQQQMPAVNTARIQYSNYHSLSEQFPSHTDKDHFNPDYGRLNRAQRGGPRFKMHGALLLIRKRRKILTIKTDNREKWT